MRGLLLLSGGFDSAVAGHLMKEKMDLAAVHFSQEPFVNKTPERKAKRIAETLRIKLIVVNISKKLEEIAKVCEHKYYFVLMKRLMLREASKVAKKEKCNYLIKGDSIAQVSSQTLDSLSVVDAAAKLPVLRPLIGFNKNEILELARKFGTFEISKGPEMCDVLGPKKATTSPKLEDVEREEEKL